MLPCKECAAHFQCADARAGAAPSDTTDMTAPRAARRTVLRDNPVEARGNLELSMWACRVHNVVNNRLGKTLFPCEKEALAERWGDCGCFEKGSGVEGPEAPAEVTR